MTLTTNEMFSSLTGLDNLTETQLNSLVGGVPPDHPLHPEPVDPFIDPIYFE